VPAGPPVGENALTVGGVAAKTACDGPPEETSVPVQIKNIRQPVMKIRRFAMAMRVISFLLFSLGLRLLN